VGAEGSFEYGGIVRLLVAGATRPPKVGGFPKEIAIANADPLTPRSLRSRRLSPLQGERGFCIRAG